MEVKIYSLKMLLSVDFNSGKRNETEGVQRNTRYIISLFWLEHTCNELAMVFRCAINTSPEFVQLSRPLTFV